jgi:hypothetical protein
VSVLRSWEYGVGAAATLLWLWDVWRRRRFEPPPQRPALARVFDRTALSDVEVDAAVEWLRVEVFGLDRYACKPVPGAAAVILPFLTRMNRRAPASLRHFNAVVAGLDAMAEATPTE